MTSIAFFAHDENDAAVRRRVRAFERTGYDVLGFTMRRRERTEGSWSRIDLGRTFDGRYLQRLKQVIVGARKAGAARDLLARSDVVYARNLDMLLCARWALKHAGLSKPLVYECLDVHRLMHRSDAIGVIMRELERRLLKETSLLVVSSPAFVREYFEKRHIGAYQARLVENRLDPAEELGPRPLARHPKTKLQIGWVGVLRCRRSLDLLEALAERHAGSVEISLCGYPDVTLPDFHERVRRRANMRYHGRYRSPEDLRQIYDNVDLVWAGDFHDAGFNSRWLLPNRLYEGGYFATPAIAPADCETGLWISEHDGGFTLDEPLERSLPVFIGRLIENPELIVKRGARLLELPPSTFVQPESEMRAVVEEACKNYVQRITPHSAPTPDARQHATV